MAELDYAFLADYAHIEGGKLSALGASYTHAQVSQVSGGLWMTSIAGRVRASADEGPVELNVRIISPGGSYEVVQSDTLIRGENSRPYGEGDTIGILFALTVALPIFAEGLFEFFIELNGEPARRLAFDMSVVP